MQPEGSEHILVDLFRNQTTENRTRIKPPGLGLTGSGTPSFQELWPLVVSLLERPHVETSTITGEDV